MMLLDQHTRRSLGRVWRHTLLVGLAALLLSGCAGEGVDFPDDGPAPPYSRASALRFAQKALTAGQSAVEAQAFTLTFTDAEVTSFLNFRRDLTREMQELGMGQLDQLEGLGDAGIDLGDINPEAWSSLLGTDQEGNRRLLPRLRLGLADPRVNFRSNGHAIGRGDVAFLRWRLPVRFVVAPQATSGELILDFVEGQIGPVRLPEIAFDLLGKGLAEALLAGQAYAEITQITVQEGAFTISGRYNR